MVVGKSAKCVILGAGGHARVVIESILAARACTLYGVLDADRSHWGDNVLGVPILGGDDLLAELRAHGVTHFAVGIGSIGDTKLRQRLFESALARDMEPLTVVHPTAVCSRSAILGSGSQLLPGSIVNAGAKVGADVVVNTGAIVEHDCVLGDHVYVATGARLSGMVRVDANAHVGIGATVRESITIGEGAVVGAGAVVVKDVQPHTVVAGVPARPLQGDEEASASCIQRRTKR